MQYLTLVNRSSKTLEGIWNGIRHQLAPGKHSFPEVMARKFKDQHPIMGSQDPYSLLGNSDFLIGIVEDGDDCTPIEQNPNAIERIDRSKMPRNTQVVPGPVGLYSARDIRAPIPAGEVGFDGRR